jgi:alpha/beta superfamily hydrolase
LPQFGDSPPVLAGFSFGSFVQTHLAQRVAPERMVLVGVAVNRFDAQAVPANTLVIHGEVDETVPLADVLDWARPQELPVIVVPGADHFFHQKLAVLRSIVQSNWRGR